MAKTHQTFAIANRSMMCSTLIGGYWTTSSESAIIQSLKSQMKNSEDKENTDKLYSAWHEDGFSERQRLDRYKVNEYAFLTGTIIAGKGIKTFEKLGFHISEKEYNGKNETHVQLVYIPVKDLIKVLELYDDNGNLIQKEKETECAA